jgi:hypothetical protein
MEECAMCVGVHLSDVVEHAGVSLKVVLRRKNLIRLALASHR